MHNYFNVLFYTPVFALSTMWSKCSDFLSGFFTTRPYWHVLFWRFWDKLCTMHCNKKSKCITIYDIIFERHKYYGIICLIAWYKYVWNRVPAIRRVTVSQPRLAFIEDIEPLYLYIYRGDYMPWRAHQEVRTDRRIWKSGGGDFCCFMSFHLSTNFITLQFHHLVCFVIVYYTL